MGQRHQVFIVARILTAQGEKHYRCVGAFHHQLCYGNLPLLAAARFLTLLKQKDNAEIIREDLRLIQGKYGRWRQSPQIPDVPLPYTTFLLASSWTVDYDNPLQPYASGVSFRNSVLGADMGSTEGDNDDGITVLDITTPENPSYCFVIGRGVPHVKGRVPISAAQYVRIYYPNPSDVNEDVDEEFVLQNIGALDRYPLVTLEVLADTWPKEYQRSLERKFKNRASEDASVASADTVIPSLAELTLKPAVEQALQTDQTTAIEDLLWMPQKAELIKAILQEQSPFPDSGMVLLTKVVGLAVESDKTIDLSHFCLSSEQIISMVAQFQIIKVLKLSHNPYVTIDTVRGVLSSLPYLRSLFLLDTSVTGGDLCDLLADEPKLFFNIEALVHPHFLQLEEETYPNAFSLVIAPTQNKTVCIASLPYFTSALIVQTLMDYLVTFSTESYDHWVLQSALVPQVILASDVRRSGQSWAERNVPLFPRFSLRAFNGEGWFFALQLPLFRHGSDVKRNKYAFVKINPAALQQTNQVQAALQHKVCDFNQFLEEMELEGRPVPAAPTVDPLVAVFKKLGDEHCLGLMNHDEVKLFIADTRDRTRSRR